MAFSGVFSSSMRGPFSAKAPVPWYLAGGVAAANCVAAYQPKGSSSLAASYVNLANPVTYNAAPGVAPTQAGDGSWTFNGSSQYLKTGIIPGPLPGWSMAIRYTGLSGNSKTLAGLYDSSAPAGCFLIQGLTGGMCIYNSGTTVAHNTTVSPYLADGIYAIVGLYAYRNGIVEPNSVADTTSSTPDSHLFIGALSYSDTPIQYAACSIQAIAIYNIIHPAPALLSVAMAAL